MSLSEHSVDDDVESDAPCAKRGCFFRRGGRAKASEMREAAVVVAVFVDGRLEGDRRMPSFASESSLPDGASAAALLSACGTVASVK